MPSWIKNITSIGHMFIMACLIGAITLLALNHIIDGLNAIGALLLATGVTSAVNGVTTRAVDNATLPTPETPEDRSHALK